MKTQKYRYTALCMFCVYVLYIKYMWRDSCSYIR